MWERIGRSSVRIAVLRRTSGIFGPHHLLRHFPTLAINDSGYQATHHIALELRQISAIVDF